MKNRIAKYYRGPYDSRLPPRVIFRLWMNKAYFA